MEGATLRRSGWLSQAPLSGCSSHRAASSPSHGPQRIGASRAGRHRQDQTERACPRGRARLAPAPAAAQALAADCAKRPSPSIDGRRKRSRIADELWDDRAESDAEQLVGLLFVAAEPLKRTDISEALRISPGRLARACAMLQADPPRGLRLLDTGDQLTLVSAPACTANIERYLGKGPPEALSQAALEVLAIVAYEQPVTGTDIRAIRGVDSYGPAETLMARKLVEEDPRFGRRGRASVSDHDVELPAALRAHLAQRPAAAPTRRQPRAHHHLEQWLSPQLADGDNQHTDWIGADGH